MILLWVQMRSARRTRKRRSSREPGKMVSPQRLDALCGGSPTKICAIRGAARYRRTTPLWKRR